MKFLSITFAALIFYSISFAQIRAITDTGEEVILYSDGTWKYANSYEDPSAQIDTNPKSFEKNEASTFLLKSTKTDFGFWIDPKIWKFYKPEDDTDAEYELELKNSDVYGMIICEAFKMPLLTLKKVALENARAVSPDVVVKQQEYRMVNGNKVLLMQMDGSIDGMTFSYYGYYFSNEKGTVQYLAYSTPDQLKEKMSEIESLLNGLTIIEQ
jgi:hypothetical protein